MNECELENLMKLHFKPVGGGTVYIFVFDGIANEGTTNIRLYFLKATVFLVRFVAIEPLFF